MKNKEIAELAGVSVSTAARMKKKPGWPGDSDPDAVVKFIQATKGRAGRPVKGQEKDYNATDEITKLNIEYKRSQIEKNNTSTRDAQLRTLKDYRHKMTKGCNEALAIIFKAIKQLDLEPDDLKKIKAAATEAKEHLKGLPNE